MSPIRSLAAALLAATILSPAAVVAETPRELAWEVVSRRPHDPGAFTQGLLFDEQGRLFESTGLRGESTLREVDARSGMVQRTVSLRDELFGEGLALVADRLIQLTWQSGEATARDKESFRALDTFEFDGEGWGLCYDGQRLVMSDGSDTLTFRDPVTFETVGSLDVTLDGQPVRNLNELECVEGAVWANVWFSDRILRIDPSNGRVDGVLDLDGIIDPNPAIARSSNVLNGIAYDAEADTFLVTGKRWPEMIEIRIDEDR